MPDHSLEHERKYLVLDDSVVRDTGEGTGIAQGYLPLHSGSYSVRVRLIPANDLYQLAVKGARRGISRLEQECSIPRLVAETLLAACGDAVIDKTRYPVLGPDGRLWTIDVFHGLNQGLVLAEIELPSPNDTPERPGWCGQEVTQDERYYNEYLSARPFMTWPKPTEPKSS